MGWGGTLAPRLLSDSHVLHRTLLICSTAPPHLAALGLHACRARGAQNFELDLVADLVDLRVDAKHHGAQHAVSSEPVVEEVDEEHDLDDAADPRLDVRVVRHLDLLIDPIEGVEDTVATECDDVQTGAPIFAQAFTITEDVLWHHRKTLDKLREGPQDLEDGVLVRQEHRGRPTWDEDHRQVARVQPPLVGSIKLVEQDQHDDGRADVRQLEEDQI